MPVGCCRYHVPMVIRRCLFRQMRVLQIAVTHVRCELAESHANIHRQNKINCQREGYVRRRDSNPPAPTTSAVMLPKACLSHCATPDDEDPLTAALHNDGIHPNGREQNILRSLLADIWPMNRFELSACFLAGLATPRARLLRHIGRVSVSAKVRTSLLDPCK